MRFGRLRMTAAFNQTHEKGKKKKSAEISMDKKHATCVMNVKKSILEEAGCGNRRVLPWNRSHAVPALSCGSHARMLPEAGLRTKADLAQYAGQYSLAIERLSEHKILHQAQARQFCVNFCVRAA